MPDAVSTAARVESSWISKATTRVRVEAPALTDWIAAFASAILLILAFPDFELSFLAWVGFVPLLLAVARRPSPGRAFVLGWFAGSLFFYGSCYWLTFSIIHYGGLSPWVAYLLLIPGALTVGLFPGISSLILALTLRKWGFKALLLAPIIWVAFEWARLGVTGQLWNAVGYSQAYHRLLIQSARWGGVYLVSFQIVAVNAAVAFAILRKSKTAILTAAVLITAVAFLIAGAWFSARSFNQVNSSPALHVVALQPNVPMTPVKTVAETRELMDRHLSMSARALRTIPNDQQPRLVIWPESPMNFTYNSDTYFQDLVAKFARDNHTSVLFNSLEPAPEGGGYNSALMVNEEGRLIAQYDKIRLLPFGEYVPLPHWLPGVSLITAIVGDFTPGEKYTLMPVAGGRAGVFICIESAYPSIARRFTREGADVLINISNDGYLGPTAVMRQHLANAIFRAVENGRPLLRATNTGITALITVDGEPRDETTGFEPAVRTWDLWPVSRAETFYTRHGDLFAAVCLTITVGVLILTLISRRRSLEYLR